MRMRRSRPAMPDEAFARRQGHLVEGHVSRCVASGYTRLARRGVAGQARLITADRRVRQALAGKVRQVVAAALGGPKDWATQA